MRIGNLLYQVKNKYKTTQLSVMSQTLVFLESLYSYSIYNIKMHVAVFFRSLFALKKNKRKLLLGPFARSTKSPNSCFRTVLITKSLGTT